MPYAGVTAVEVSNFAKSNTNIIAIEKVFSVRWTRARRLASQPDSFLTILTVRIKSYRVARRSETKRIPPRVSEDDRLTFLLINTYGTTPHVLTGAAKTILWTANQSEKEDKERKNQQEILS